MKKLTFPNDPKGFITFFMGCQLFQESFNISTFKSILFENLKNK